MPKSAGRLGAPMTLGVPGRRVPINSCLSLPSTLGIERAKPRRIPRPSPATPARRWADRCRASETRADQCASWLRDLFEFDSAVIISIN